MKKLLSILSKGMLALLALIILILAFLSARYSLRYVYRLARYNVADVYDYTHFRNRVIGASDSAFNFPVGLDESYVESLFREKVVSYGFSSLEENLWSRIMEYDALFSIDNKRSGFEYMPSRLMARAIDYARFGQLFLHEGNLGQDIYILPGEETIIVHCGNSLEHYNADLLRSVAEAIRHTK